MEGRGFEMLRIICKWMVIFLKYYKYKKKICLEKYKNIIGEKEIINIELEIYNIYIYSKLI